MVLERPEQGVRRLVVVGGYEQGHVCGLVVARDGQNRGKRRGRKWGRLLLLVVVVEGGRGEKGQEKKKGKIKKSMSDAHGIFEVGPGCLMVSCSLANFGLLAKLCIVRSIINL